MEHADLRKELELLRRKDAVAERLRRARGVPRPIISALEGLATNEERDWSRPDAILGELTPAVEALPERGLRALTKALLPSVAPAFEAAWAAQSRRPYTQGETRRPFRCPRSAEGLANVRARLLAHVVNALGPFDGDIVWVAAWASHLHLWRSRTDLGWLLAGALDIGDAQSDEVLAVLKAATTNDHEVARMGRHVICALMASSRVDAWEFNERLLLAAQRQEGLRQSILEAVDEAHPEAFRRMLRLILDADLARFSSVVRAVDTWFGFGLAAGSQGAVESVLRRVLTFFDDPRERDAALASGTADDAYLALWALAFDDIELAVPAAVALCDDASAERRYVGTHLLVQSDWAASCAPLAARLGDEDLRVAQRALHRFDIDVGEHLPAPGAFDALASLMGRFEKRKVAVGAIVWPWTESTLERERIAAALSRNSKGVPIERMLPYVRDMGVSARGWFIKRAAGITPSWEVENEPDQVKPLAGAEHTLALELLGDIADDASSAAFEALAATPLGAAETQRLVELSSRKAGALRTRILTRLAQLGADELVAVVERLTSDKDALRRVAGLELLRGAAGQRVPSQDAARIAGAYRAAHAELTDEERGHLDALSDTTPHEPTRDDAFGLVDPARLPRWAPPRQLVLELATPAALACFESLAEFLSSHATTEVVVRGETKLFSQSWSAFELGGDRAERDAALPLRDELQAWLHERSRDQRDPDGLELVRARFLWVDGHSGASPELRDLVDGERPGHRTWLFVNVLAWLVQWQDPPGRLELMLDCLEATLAGFDADELALLRERGGRRGWVYGRERTPCERREERAQHLCNSIRQALEAGGLQRAETEQPSASTLQRWYALRRGFALTTLGAASVDVGFHDFVAALRAGAFAGTAEAELIDLLVGRASRTSRVLDEASGRHPEKVLGDWPELLAAVERCRVRVVEIEVARGDRPTAATYSVGRLRWTGGLETLAPALMALGRAQFARNEGWRLDALSRQEALSRLVQRSMPRTIDDHAAFARWARDAKPSEGRLVELAAYAPQWAGHVAHVLGWPGFESAVWWLHAHTKDTRWELRELREEWAAQVAERTPLSADDLSEGAVDVEWFHLAHAALGAERWKKVDGAAKYASSAGGHKRAQTFAGAMLGEHTVEDLLARIDGKRHQDSVRALGLVPLPAAAPAREEDLARRYMRLQAFARESRQFGSQRQASEGRAVALGLENLARAAGFRDPLRLSWAMEQAAVADLAHGPVTVERGDVRVSLALDPEGRADVRIERGGRELQALPAALRKDEALVALRARAKELRTQASRVKGALETAMVRGDVFDGVELHGLLRHPLLAAALSRLLFVGPTGALGYPAAEGRALVDHAGKVEPVGQRDALRLAHPHDLLATGAWSAWQRECVRAERLQPFKQVFRELYPLTTAERGGATLSRRYAGQQLNPRQALALLGARGWVAQPDEGVSKTDHAAGFTARLGFQEAFYTPADVEGLTLAGVGFSAKGKSALLPLEELPPRFVSEAFRDLDLVVSVAHVGGVDPEASASTVEMRANLTRELCVLMGLTNVRVAGHHAHIEGELGRYTVHLGSAATALASGRHVVIVAVHSQHRGRVFLPFADDDPRTAEVLAKVLLLARDRGIQDPRILDQLRGD